MALTGALGATFFGCDGDEATDTAAGGGGSSASSSSSSSASSSSTSTSGVVSSSSSSGSGQVYLGLPCSSDEQCGPQGRCITPADDDPVLGGGAVGGYCTGDCVTAADCAGVGSPCVDGTCLLSCIIGPELTYIDDPLAESKCHGREDLRCAPSENGEVCLPTCGSDSQCPGRFCDPRFGVCVDSPSTGNPTGTVCNENLPDPGCAGFCQTFTNSIQSICTSPCVLGGELDALDCGGLSNGLCVYRPSGYGAGDFGRCAAACTQHDQCGNPDWWCFSTSFTTNGFCFTAEDCTSSAGCEVDEACVATASGLKCLEWDPASCGAGGSGGSAGNGCDTLFPLGSAAPGGGGAGGAGGAGGSTGGAGGSTGGAGGSTSAGGAGGAGGSTGGAGGT